MEKPPAFQLYARDIYVGTSDLSGEELGAYVRGLCWSWDNGPLPLDPRRRARLMMVDWADFERLWSDIAPNWIKTAGGFINARLEKQRAELEAYRLACAENGAKGGRPKKAKHNPSVNPQETERLTQQEPETNLEPNPIKSTPDSGLRSALSDLPTADAEIPPAWRPQEPRPQTNVEPRRNHAKCFPAPLACKRGICLPQFQGDNWAAQLAEGQPEGFAATSAVIARMNAILDATPAGTVVAKSLQWWQERWEKAHAQAPRQRAESTADSALEALLDRIGLEQFYRRKWFKRAELSGDVLSVLHESAEWVAHAYLRQLEIAHGAPLRIAVIEETAVAS